MKEIQEIKTKVESGTVTLKVVFEKYGSKSRKVRFYVDDALREVKERHPELKFGKMISGGTAKNYQGTLEFEWVFELLKKDAKKPVAPEVLADAKQEPVHKDKGVLKGVAEPPKKKTTKKKNTRKTLKSVKQESKEVISD